MYVSDGVDSDDYSQIVGYSARDLSRVHDLRVLHNFTHSYCKYGDHLYYCIIIAPYEQVFLLHRFVYRCNASRLPIITAD